MDNDTGLLCPSICMQMHPDDSSSYAVSHGADMPTGQQPPDSDFTSIHQQRRLLSHFTLPQHILDPNLFRDSFTHQPPISAVAHTYDNWGSTIESNTLCNLSSMYDKLEDKQDALPWEDVAIPTDPDFDLFSTSYPILDDLSELDTFDYHPSRRPETLMSLQPQTYESHSSHSLSSYPRQPINDYTSRPERATYPPCSPINSVGSSSPVERHGFRSSDSIARSVPEHINLPSEDETDDDSVSSEEPYARLIWKALMSAPGHKMVLKEIYEWFEKHTSKAKNSDSKGWQNSIRHNLSMNAAFEGVKEPLSPGSQTRKSGNVWILTERAIRNGVQSTTRYRKPGIHKKAQKSDHPAPQRQRSGARGGRAAKKAAKYRRAFQESQRLGRISHNNATATDVAQGHSDLLTRATTYVEYQPTESSNNYSLNDYGFGSLMGCSDLTPRSPLFYPEIDLDGNHLLPRSSVLECQPISRDFNSLLQ